MSAAAKTAIDWMLEQQAHTMDLLVAKNADAFPMLAEIVEHWRQTIDEYMAARPKVFADKHAQTDFREACVNELAQRLVRAVGR